MNSRTASRSVHDLARSEVGRPSAASTSYPWDWVSIGQPLAGTHPVHGQAQPAHVRPDPLDLGGHPGHAALGPLQRARGRIPRPGGLQRGGGLGQLLLAAVDPLAQGAGRGVARVGERRATQGQLLVVDPLEVGHGEEHLPPDLDQRRHGRIIGRGQPRRDRGDELRVVGDVLPHTTVAPGGHRDQAPGPVDDVDRQPVDLQLAQHRREPVDRALDPLGPRRRAPRR